MAKGSARAAAVSASAAGFAAFFLFYQAYRNPRGDGQQNRADQYGREIPDKESDHGGVLLSHRTLA